jgi:hypothetical protein
MANDSVASHRRYQMMNYAPRNALGFSKKSQANIIVYRHVAPTQRNSFTSWRFATGPDLRSRYNRYRMPRRWRALSAH